MTKKLGLVAITGLIAAFALLTSTFEPQADEVEVPEASKPRRVTEDEVKLYIDVYGAMQRNHDLTIDGALAPHGISLSDFRALERRVQKDSRVVEKVREALLEQVKQTSMFAQAAPSPTEPQQANPPGAAP